MTLWRRADPPPAELLTGERLQGLAEVSLMSRQTRDFHRNVERYVRRMVVYEEDMRELSDQDVRSLDESSTLFVYTHDLDAFMDVVWPRMTRAGQVLISHNSDHEVAARHLEWLDGPGRRLGRWFAQNASVAHAKLEPIPIGISNTMWPHGNLRILARAMRRQARRSRTGLIFVQFSTSTHPSRVAAEAALTENFPHAHVDGAPSLPWPRYLDTLGSHRFSACPRGNGLDTHRIWESLYLGVIPIIDRSVLTEHWRDVGLPIVIVDDWAEVTPERLDQEAERLRTVPLRHARMRLSTYASLVAEAAGSASMAVARS
jgi:hypothetical protein